MDYTINNKTVSFIWSIADDCLRDVYVRGKYRDVILPMFVLRRLDCLLEKSKAAVLEEVRFQREDAGLTDLEQQGLQEASGYVFYNISDWTLTKLVKTATNNRQILEANFKAYLDGFSDNVKEIIEKFELRNQIRRMVEADVLLGVLEKFIDPRINLSPDEAIDPDGRKLPPLSNLGMGYVFEELIRKFNEENNEEAGEHFTPREVIDLMTHILFEPVKDRLPPVITVYDGACGSGGMLTESQNFVIDPEGRIRSNASVYLYGKEVNGETYAICKSDMMIKGNDPANIKFGSTLATDEFAGMRFYFMLSNPPYGKSWKGEQKSIIENDWLEAIIQLPNNLFYNTGITTYIWVLSNHKAPNRRGKVQLIDASEMYRKLRKNLGAKNCEFAPEHIEEITEIYLEMRSQFAKYDLEGRQREISKVFDNRDFGYYKVTVERPLRLAAQFTAERVESLRFVPALREVMEWAYGEWGDRLYADLATEPKYKKAIEEYIDKEELTVSPKNRKDLLSAKTWETQRDLMRSAERLMGHIGADLYLDFNQFAIMFDDALKKLEIKLSSSEKNQVLNAISWRDESAAKVVKKLHKLKGDKLNELLESLGTVQENLQDYGFWATGVKGEWVEYESDSELRNYVLKEVDERSNNGNEELLSVSHLTGVTPRSEKNVNMFLAEDYSGSKLCQENDLVINTMWAWMGTLGVSSSKGIVSSAYGVYRPNEKVSPRFLDRLLRTSTYIAEYIRRSTGIQSSRLRLYPEQFLDISLILPTLEEQNRIANFLDRTTTSIDQEIAKKQRLIELLNEQKAILINRAVTKGLNPNVPMRDSGIEWIGEIPEHWEIKKLGYTGSFQNGISEGANYFGSGYPFVNYTDVYKNIVLPKNVIGLAKSTETDRQRYSVKKGDIFFTRTSETIEEIGLTSICLEDLEKAIFSGFLIRFRPLKKLLIEDFSKYYFRAQIHRFFFVKEMNLITRASLSQDLLKRLPLFLPPKSEQKTIASFLDQKTKEVDNANFKTQQQIDKLTEFKQIIIANAVTGKIKV